MRALRCGEVKWGKITYNNLTEWQSKQAWKVWAKCRATWWIVERDACTHSSTAQERSVTCTDKEREMFLEWWKSHYQQNHYSALASQNFLNTWSFVYFIFYHGTDTDFYSGTGQAEIEFIYLFMYLFIYFLFLVSNYFSNFVFCESIENGYYFPQTLLSWPVHW